MNDYQKGEVSQNPRKRANLADRDFYIRQLELFCPMSKIAPFDFGGFLGHQNTQILNKIT